ncbi:class I SAM-dependent methyltransferase [Lentisphaerota bacterium ZTH]|nr:class I SAM-dependent methyltransferase [Lentisphaerota bacterium]WET06406.1 class I SAM-dependent methyltransferase [Lentisphaerota bacterium ZTH]
MKNIIKKIYKLLTEKACYREFCKYNNFSPNERAIEYNFVFRHLAKVFPEKILDVGPGLTALPNLMSSCGFNVTAVDNVKDFWESDIINRHFYVKHDDITRSKLKEKYDIITCISVLEHIVNFDAAVQNMVSLLKDNGYLIITFPYNENNYCKNVYDLEKSVSEEKRFTTQAFSRHQINCWLEANKVEIVEQEYWQFWTGDYWTEGKFLAPPRKVTAKDKHHHTCLVIKK